MKHAAPEVAMNGSTHRPILFVGMSYSGVNPMFVIANELSRRGRQGIWFATEEHLRADVERLSAESKVGFASLGEATPGVTPSMWDDESYRTLTQRSKWKGLLALTRQMADSASYYKKYRLLEAEVEHIKPALMIIDVTCLHAIDLAMTRKIPYVLSSPYILSATCGIFNVKLPRGYPTPLSGFPRRMTPSQQVANQLFRLWTKVLPLALGMEIVRFARVFKKVGVTVQLDPTPRLKAAEMVLCYSMPGIDYPFPAPGNVHAIGAMIPPLPQIPGDEVTDWLEAHDSTVFIAFGTVTRLTREQVGALVEAVGRLGDEHAVLWKLPRAQQALLPPADELPGNLRIEDWIPSQLDVLAHPNVRVFFNHAGANSFHEGVHFGKPMLILPLWFDCNDIAERAVDSGVGLVVDQPETIDPDEVVGKLTRLLTEESFRAQAGHWAERQRATGGVRTAADLILGCSAVR
jgi:polyene glycosyltransferase